MLIPNDRYTGRICAALLAASAASLSGCYSAAVSGMPPSAPINALRKTASPIKHVVFIIQENRSFNNLFMGYPGTATQSYGYDTSGNKIDLQPEDLSTIWDIDHSANAFFAACDGTGSLPGTDCKMDGWNNEISTLHHPPNPAYSYVPRNQITPYWTMAQRYVLSDENFTSSLDASFSSHQYAVAAYAHRAVNGPSGDWGCEGDKSDTIATLTDARTYGPRVAPCFDSPTLGREADKAGLTWRFYAEAVGDLGGMWSAYQADREVYKGADWTRNVISPSSRFLTDVANGQLANITWITPTFAASDHAGFLAGEGPAWVASLVDAIGKSKYWKSTAIFITWDDWGGFFDPVQPVFMDYDGLGFRVPLIVVSPYAKKGSVTHVQYETASVLRFIEGNFGLRQLGASDTRANDPGKDPAIFDFQQPPRKFKKIPGAQPSQFWERLERSSRTRYKSVEILGSD